MADIQLANTIGVAGTPTIILNGRMLPDAQPSYVEELIRHLIAQN